MPTVETTSTLESSISTNVPGGSGLLRQPAGARVIVLAYLHTNIRLLVSAMIVLVQQCVLLRRLKEGAYLLLRLPRGMLGGTRGGSPRLFKLHLTVRIAGTRASRPTLSSHRLGRSCSRGRWCSGIMMKGEAADLSGQSSEGGAVSV